MSTSDYDDPDKEMNYVEAHIIIQEFHDDPTIFVVGSAPFGKIWFDRTRIQKQYDVLSADWEEEYGGKVMTHSKKPRIVRVLLEEKDVIFPDDVVEEPKNEVIQLSTTPDSTSEPVPIPVPTPVVEPVSEKKTRAKKEPKPPKEPKKPKEPKPPKEPKKPKEPKQPKTPAV